MWGRPKTHDHVITYERPTLTGIRLPLHVMGGDTVELTFHGKRYSRVAPSACTLETAEEVFEFVGLSEFMWKMIAAGNS